MAMPPRGVRGDAPDLQPLPRAGHQQDAVSVRPGLRHGVAHHLAKSSHAISCLDINLPYIYYIPIILYSYFIILYIYCIILYFIVKGPSNPISPTPTPHRERHSHKEHGDEAEAAADHLRGPRLWRDVAVAHRGDGHHAHVDRGAQAVHVLVVVHDVEHDGEHEHLRKGAAKVRSQMVYNIYIYTSIYIMHII